MVSNVRWLAGLLLCGVLIGCPSLRVAPINDPDAGAVGNNNNADGATTEKDAATTGDGGGEEHKLGTYDAEQSLLESKRFPGPVTAQGSRGLCTPKYFIWRDSDGTLHSWSGETQARIDYAFKAAQRAYYGPSESYIPVDTPPLYDKIAVYQTGAANGLVTQIDYAFHFLASTNGIVRLDQKIGNVDLDGTKVRFYNAATTITEDISALLPTKQPPSSFGNDAEVVIPGDVNVPFALWIVNIAKKTTTSVTFDGGIAIRQTLPSPHGLFVSYARSGPTSALRLYRDNKNEASSRFELGDELANRPNVFTDTSPGEHALLTQIAIYKDAVIYDSAFGLWSYNLIKATLLPVQLGPNKKVFVTDVMCVLRDPGLLVYRITGDALGQIWAVPLASILP